MFKLISYFLPPIIVIIYQKLFFKITGETLFDGDGELFKKNLSEHHVYGEYGVGLSTLYAVSLGVSDIISIENDKIWLNKLREDVPKKVKWQGILVDCGKIVRWGRPISLKQRKNFLKYAEELWHQNKKPNFVLIDGRFRALCFFVSLKYADEGTCILFDDYTDRINYHFVEEYIKPSIKNARQALFIVPNKSKLDMNKIEKEIQCCSYIIE